MSLSLSAYTYFWPSPCYTYRGHGLSDSAHVWNSSKLVLWSLHEFKETCFLVYTNTFDTVVGYSLLGVYAFDYWTEWIYVISFRISFSFLWADEFEQKTNAVQLAKWSPSLTLIENETAEYPYTPSMLMCTTIKIAWLTWADNYPYSKSKLHLVSVNICIESQVGTIYRVSVIFDFLRACSILLPSILKLDLLYWI